MNTLFRALPSMDACLKALEQEESLQDCPRPLVHSAVENFLNDIRTQIKAGKPMQAEKLHLEALMPRLLPHVIKSTRPRLQRTLNATGVVIHTNMGRSVLPKAAVEAVHQAIMGYSNLELDLSHGGRGSRQSIVEDLLCHISGAEAAMVVNNNAAAVLLVLDALCKGGEVIVSRGQLVEIGGSFRIPDVMERSGATLREVGTTNRTHIEDYERAINENTIALMRVHTSNYRIVGFHKEVPLPELVALGEQHNLPIIEDLGSGSLVNLHAYGLPDEPTVQEVVQGGAHVVTFSGDKVLGGPQAGIIVGKKELIERMRKNPLHRALRCDKCTLAALEATLRIYAQPQKALEDIPTLRMITSSSEELSQKAQALLELLQEQLGHVLRLHTQEDVSRVGGGSFPERDLPTTLVCLKPKHLSATQLKNRLLEIMPPLIGRLEENAFCLDVRTLASEEWPEVVAVLEKALSKKIIITIKDIA